MSKLDSANCLLFLEHLRQTGEFRPSSIKMRSNLQRCSKLIFLVLNAMLFTAALAASNSQVLILNSYHQGMDWTDDEVAGIKSSLAKTDLPVELHMEYIDSKRLVDETHLDNLRRLLAHKYRSTPLQAVVVTDNDAFNFARRHRGELFPGVPVVFCGVNWFKDENFDGLSGFTGVVEAADSAATIRLMLGLHPETKRIIVIIDHTTTGKALRSELESVATSIGQGVTFEFWSNLHTHELTGNLSALSANDLVLLMPYSSDPNGRFISFHDIAKLVTEQSPVPTYSSWDFYLGHGIVGGHLTTARIQGRAAGDMLVRILSGESADNIPVQQQIAGEFAFDNRQLTRFSIPKSRLPDNSTVTFLPWYETNQRLILLAALIALTMVSLLWALVVSLARKRQVDAALRRNIATLTSRDNALHEISQGVMITGADRRITYVNRAVESISGYSKEELMGKSCKLLQGPETSEEAKQQIRNALNTAKPFSGEILNYCKDGSSFWNSLSISPVFDAKGQLTQFVGIQNDITKRKLADVELRIAAKAFESQVAMLVADAQGVVLRVNHAFVNNTGYGADEVLGQKTSLLKSGRQDKAFYEKLWAALKDQHYWQGVIWNRRKNGSVYAEWLTINAVVSPTGETTHYVASFSDITQNKEAEAEVHRLAYYDPLTQFPNRRLLHDRLGQALASAAQHASFGAVLFLDLDFFNTLNITRGHTVGDLLLIQVGQRLREALPQSETVARLGGDEFVVILEELDTDADTAATKAKNIGNTLNIALAQSYDLKGIESNLTASIGICLFSGEQTVEQLLKNAEFAMYQAKDDGRKTLRFFDPAMQAKLDKHSVLENDLRRALDHQELRLVYQPQVNHAGQIIGAEILLRWKHPERGFISPLDFIPMAEETGLILPIGDWVLRSACEQIKRWSQHTTTSKLRISVNVSSLQFRQERFVEEVSELLKVTGIDPAHLKLELTESMVLHDVEKTIEKMQALKKMDVTFSMDDFGTGYSSLAYLTRLPLDELKIDKSFVSNLPDNHNDGVIAQTIITMGQSLGLGVVAEGVETEQQRAFLQEHGCHVYQGYLFSRPVSIDDFMVLLEKTQQN